MTEPTSSLRARSANGGRSQHAYLPQDPGALVLPEGDLSEETVALLNNFVHHGHPKPLASGDSEETLAPADGDDDDFEEEELKAMQAKPWYRRPSPWWLLCFMPVSAAAVAACAAPRVEVYTQLACWELRPEYTVGERNSPLGSIHTKIIERRKEWTEDDSIDLSTIVDTKSFSFDANFSMNAGRDDEDNAQKKCAKDPVVQAAVAKLIALVATTMGVLTCLTTAFWGSLSDRWGRLKIMGISAIGLLITDFVFILVYFCSQHLPGGYYFLLVGPVFEGAFGGIATGVAALNAYIADCTPSASRSQVFSMGVGLLFLGMGFGPSIGALLVAFTHKPISVFYFGTAVHFTYAMLVWLIIPESLSPRVRAANSRKRELELREAEIQSVSGGSGIREKAIKYAKRAFGFLSPLIVFAPVEINDGGLSTKKKRDWSLTLIAFALGSYSLVMASYQFKFQFAQSTFGWSSEELGFWLTLVGSSRAFYLTLILPVVIKYFQRRMRSRPSENLRLSDSSLEPSEGDPLIHRSTSAHSKTEASSNTPAVDLALARFSCILEAICYTAIPLAPTVATFTAFGMLAAWGGGFNPAMHALALELFSRRNKNKAEAGKLFGALSVVSSLSSQIIGPSLFGVTYMKTVATFPKAIFFLSTACVSVTLFCTLLVRLPNHLSDVEESRGTEREDTLVT